MHDFAHSLALYIRPHVTEEAANLALNTLFREGGVYPLAAKLSTSREARKHRIVTDTVHQHDAKVPYKFGLYIQQPIYRTLSFVVDSFADSSWRKIHLWAMEGMGGAGNITTFVLTLLSGTATYSFWYLCCCYSITDRLHLPLFDHLFHRLCHGSLLVKMWSRLLMHL